MIRSPAPSQTSTPATDREVIAAARVLLARMGVDPADLMRETPDRPRVPTFDEYIPQVADGVSPGTARTYGSYWKRIAAKWGRKGVRVIVVGRLKQRTFETREGQTALYLERPADLDRYTWMFTELTRLALDDEASCRLIAKVKTHL